MATPRRFPPPWNQRSRLTRRVSARRVALAWLITLLAISFTSESEPVDAGELRAAGPNILLIYTDDQSYRTVGCYPESYSWVKTPNIDALAKTGIRFQGAYLGAWCMPSRATLLTGRQPHAIESMRMEGVYPGSTYDPKQCPFWPAVFRQHGYQTAQIGKWHTGVDAGFGRDWDFQIVWNRPKHPENAGNYYDNQILVTNGGEERLTSGYSTDNYTQWACEYIRGQHRDPNKPWYLWLCYGGVHGPAHPAKRHVGHYRDATVEPPADIFAPRPGKPEYLNLTQAWRKGPNGVPVMGASGEAFGDESGKRSKTHQAFVQQVNECALALDEGIGQVMAALRESGQLANTLVVFTADQGFSMGEHGFRTKVAPYDANYRSPLIVSRPGTLPEGKVSPHRVNGADLVVTFFRAAGIELPWQMHGRDITPLLTNPEQAKWPHPCFYEGTGRSYGSDVTRIVREKGPAKHGEIPWYVAVVEDQLKYIRYLYPGVPDELYDLRTDPEELTNLATNAKYAKSIEKLKKTLLQELRYSEAGFIDQL